jgi:hypothetical protein
VSAPGASSGGMWGRWRVALRVAWILVTLVGVAITFASAPVLFEQYRTPCSGAPESCLELSQLTPVGLRALEEAGISSGLYAAIGVGVAVFSNMVWVAVGTLVFLLRSDDRMALVVAFFLVTFGTATLPTEGVDALISVHPAWLVPGRGVQVLGEVFAVLFFLTFPGGRFVPRWTRWLGAAFLAFQIPGDLFPDAYSALPALEAAQGVVFICFVLGMLLSQIYRYRNVSTPAQRRQTRWVVSGTALALLSLFAVLIPFFILGSRLAEASPFFSFLIQVFIPMVMLLIPISIGVAMLRSGLFDIDVVINRALVYGTLTVSLVLLYLGGVAGMQQLLNPLLGGSNQLAIVVSTLAIAALFNPLRRRIQGFIDRRFYRSKYDAAKTLAAFTARLREETELDTLSGDVVGVVRETMQPAHVGFWLRPPIGVGKVGGEGREQ